MQNERSSDGPLEEVADDGEVQQNPHGGHQVGELLIGETIPWFFLIGELMEPFLIII